MTEAIPTQGVKAAAALAGLIESEPSFKSLLLTNQNPPVLNQEDNGFSSIYEAVFAIFKEMATPSPKKIFDRFKELYPDSREERLLFTKWLTQQEFYLSHKANKPKARDIIQDKRATIEEWINKGLSVLEIARRLNLPSNTVSEALRALNFLPAIEGRTTRNVSIQGRLLHRDYRDFIKDCLRKGFYGPTIVALINKKESSNNGVVFKVQNVNHYINAYPELRALAIKRPPFIVKIREKRLNSIDFSVIVHYANQGLRVKRLCEVLGISIYTLTQRLKQEGYNNYTDMVCKLAAKSH
jgi:hypothetical protein